MCRADVKHDEERGLKVGRQGGDNSSKGLDASPRSSNDHNVSRGPCQASRRAFSIARLDADHPVPPLLSRHSPDVSHHSVHQRYYSVPDNFRSLGLPSLLQEF
jgi:hypothetical protein